MKKKIYVNICGLALLTILFISVIFVSFSNHTLHEQMQESTKTEAAYVAAACESLEDPVSFFEELSAEISLRITYIQKDGNVLYDNHANAAGLENHLKRPEIQEASANGFGSESRLSNTLREETYYYAVRLENGDFVRVSSVSDSMLQTFLNLLPVIGMASLAVLLCSLFIARMLAKGILKSINSIDLKKPLDSGCFEELWPLLSRIEKQNIKIDEQVNVLLEQQQKFNTITENMNEGLILLDESGKINFINGSCKNLFHAPSMHYIGKSISLFNRSFQMQSTVDAALKGDISSAVLNLDERVVQVFGNPVIEEGHVRGAVLFILDVTQKQKAEQMRKEFSANVSHELKTPLTSISGYAELMQNGMAAPEDVPGFAKKIYDEAARLIVLVNDIIKISRLDEKDIRQSKETVNLFQMAGEIRERLEHVAEKAGVTLELEGETVNVCAVRSMMDDLIYNLCENGIKYNRPGGNVQILITERDQHPIIQVSDTGIGIPREYQERIFERFYRIDKSHSKQTGGTGLGLAIVKHVVEYHNGYIEIHSVPDEGTVITIHL